MDGTTTVAELLREVSAVMDEENTDTVTLTARIDGQLVELEIRVIGLAEAGH